MPDTFRLKKNKVDSYWKDVWMRFKSGDIKAFELIYGDHIDFLYSYGTKMTADTEMVEDAIQDLFLYLLSKRDNLSNPDFVRYYLLKAFKRILLEKIRKEKLWIKDKDNNFFSFDYSIDTESFSLDDEKERKLVLVEELLEKLDPRKKEIIFLKFHSGLSYDEIGDIVGIQSSSVKKLVYRTISSFRDILKNKIIGLFFLFSRSSNVRN
ncbi:MAG: sigma-70 family RNA polymerase sigma factor [Prolixibacteraceae bacterium]